MNNSSSKPPVADGGSLIRTVELIGLLYSYDSTAMAFLKIYCLVNGESSSEAFPVNVDASDTIGDLKELILPKITDTLKAKDLTLWRVSIPVDDLDALIGSLEDKKKLLDSLPNKTELKPTDDICEVFKEAPPKKTIHIIVQPPQSGNTSLFVSYWSLTIIPNCTNIVRTPIPARKCSDDLPFPSPDPPLSPRYPLPCSPCH